MPFNILLGRKGPGDAGIYIAPPGLDAQTCPTSNLNLWHGTRLFVCRMIVTGTILSGTKFTLVTIPSMGPVPRAVIKYLSGPTNGFITYVYDSDTTLRVRFKDGENAPSNVGFEARIFPMAV